MRTQYHADFDRLVTLLVAMSVHDLIAVAAAANAVLDADLREAEHTLHVCAEIESVRDRCKHAAVGSVLCKLPSPASCVRS